MSRTQARQLVEGITLIELVISLLIASLIIAGLAGVVNNSLRVEEDSRLRTSVNAKLEFAMQRIVRTTKESRLLLLPLSDNPSTNWPEHIREQTVPPSPPIGDSTLATAVLAVAMPHSWDFDEDGWADANNDKDFLDRNQNAVRDSDELERVDEDLDGDATNDGQPGIIGIDDDGDGSVDESSVASPANDDDEDDLADEDTLNGIDDDGDGSVDEDFTKDMNSDNEPGVINVDDDLDGLVDEGNQKGDDDEDGSREEDWIDAVVFYLNGDELVERLPASTDINGDTEVTGADFTERTILESVTRFRIERVPITDARSPLVDITLEVTVDGQLFSLNTRVRVGAGL